MRYLGQTFRSCVERQTAKPIKTPPAEEAVSKIKGCHAPAA
jgi:hypothetical protein